MERQEIVNNIKEAFQNVTATLVATMNNLREDMKTHIEEINRAKSELIIDNETLYDIQVATEDFLCDLGDVSGGMLFTVDTVNDILETLDQMPNSLSVYEEATDTDEDEPEYEVESNEDTVVNE